MHLLENSCIFRLAESHIEKAVFADLLNVYVIQHAAWKMLPTGQL